MNSSLEFFSAFKEATAQKVSSAFEKFLNYAINISQGIRSIASNSHNHLREFLSSEAGRDNSFPRILSIEDNDFLGGSFARHTKIWPLDDIDIYFPLDGHSLIYSEYGVVQPYTILSDSVILSNPLLQPRWMKGNYISSEKLISEFARVLNRHYPNETNIKKHGQAVTVRTSYGENSASDGLGFDVVPCFAMKPRNNSDYDFYLMPSGKDGWIRTNPRLDTLLAEQLHKKNNRTYRKVVKLLKYWNEFKLGSAFTSYFIELSVAKIYLKQNEKYEYVNKISFGIALGFWALKEAFSKGHQVSFIPKAPSIQPGSISPIDSLRLTMDQIKSNEAWDFEKAGYYEKALSKWKEIFGDEFLRAE